MVKFIKQLQMIAWRKRKWESCQTSCPHSRALMLVHTSLLFSPVLSAVTLSHSTQSNMLSERLRPLVRDSAPPHQALPLHSLRGYCSNPGMTVTHSCSTGCRQSSAVSKEMLDRHVISCGCSGVEGALRNFQECDFPPSALHSFRFLF